MDISLADINTKTLSLTGSSGAFVQGQSVLAVFVQGVQAVDSLSVQVGSKAKTSTASSLVFGIVDSADVTVTVTVTGTPTTFTRQLTLLPYAPVALTASATRGANTSASISLSGVLASLGGKNALVGLKYRYKATDSTVWGDYIDLMSATTINGTAINYTGTAGPFDRSKSYNFEFVARDALTEFVVSVLLSATDTLLAGHPVGDIVFNTSGLNPGTYLGGTWVIWSVGRTPVGVDTSQAEFGTVEKAGGEKYHQLTHNELPAFRVFTGDMDAYMRDNPINSALNSGTIYGLHYPWIGSNVPHNNLPPYTTCYYWKRTA